MIIQEIVAKTVNCLYEKRQRKRLKNENITIFSSNCIGGVIYHRLGLPFLSPTINLFIHQNNFMKFIRNPQKYLSTDLQFVSTERPYPVAELLDISIYFVHSKTNKEAEDAWNRRKERINWDNIYIIMYDRDGITEDDVIELGHITYAKNVIMLSERKNFCKYPYVKYIEKKHPQNKDSMVFLDKDCVKLRTFEKQWDFVEFLNQSRH